MFNKDTTVSSWKIHHSSTRVAWSCDDFYANFSKSHKHQKMATNKSARKEKSFSTKKMAPIQPWKPSLEASFLQLISCNFGPDPPMKQIQEQTFPKHQNCRTNHGDPRKQLPTQPILPARFIHPTIPIQVSQETSFSFNAPRSTLAWSLRDGWKFFPIKCDPWSHGQNNLPKFMAIVSRI